MARSEILIALLRASLIGDREKVKAAAASLIADERLKKHHILADRLEQALAVRSSQAPQNLITNPALNSTKDALIEIKPRIQLDDLTLPKLVWREAVQIIDEHQRADVLRSFGYEPRHRLLLAGPPGNGKTSFAEAIAEGLALPLYVVRYDSLIGSYLGETNTRLNNLFAYIKSRPCVLFFDEFDSVGKERGDVNETGEIKRIVSFLLMQIDQLPSYVVLIAATNHAELLDRAVWRRFQARLAFPMPDALGRENYIKHVVSSWGENLKISYQKIAHDLGEVSFAETLDFCKNVRRRQILSLGDLTVDDAVRIELQIWMSRLLPEEANGFYSGSTSSAIETSDRSSTSNRRSARNAVAGDVFKGPSEGDLFTKI